MHYHTTGSVSGVKSLYLSATRAYFFNQDNSSANRDDYVNRRFPNVYKRRSIG